MRRRSYVRVNLDRNLWWRRIAGKVNETDSAFCSIDLEVPTLPLSRNVRLVSESGLHWTPSFSCPSLNALPPLRSRNSGCLFSLDFCGVNTQDFVSTSRTQPHMDDLAVIAAGRPFVPVAVRAAFS